MEEEQDWQAEGEAVIRDVQPHVTSIHVSQVTPSGRGVYLNITTIEDLRFCVLLGPAGFQVVGNEHDCTSLATTNQISYETPYALLSSISPSYDQSFGNLLMKKLNELSQQSATDR